MSNSKALKDIITAARPLIEQWLATGEQIAALREAATAQELDWGPIKALLKAQIQDEADDGNRVEKLLAKADKSMAYADMLGWGFGKPEFSEPEKKNNFSSPPPHDPETGEIAEKPVVQMAQEISDKIGDGRAPEVDEETGDVALTIPLGTVDAGDVPEFLRRAK